jgi:hypothetical protein
MSIKKSNPPSSKILMNSLRQMGYTFEAALADIVDNSISANASIIEIDSPPNPQEIYITVVDNGVGMDEEELLLAMKYGSKNSLEERALSDLGRFGLGLKLASLSLCRILTVASKKNGKLLAMRWDLDSNAEEDWCIEILANQELMSLPNIQKLLSMESGTLVLWQNFDLLNKISGGKIYKELSDKVVQAIFHISLVYHRFLTKPYNITISVNNKLIKPLNPFLTNHPKARTLRQPERLSVLDDKDIERSIQVEAVVLPYQSELSIQDIESLGGIDKLRTMQGFYVYRNDRLIIWATWFKIKPDSELTKYARIKVDIPSTLDNIWQIDIRKSDAQLPSKIRNTLRAYVDDVMQTSVRRSTHRTVLKNKEISHIWELHETRDKKKTFKINRHSEVYKNLKKRVDEDQMTFFEEFLDYVEKTVPYQDMYVEVANGNISNDVSDQEKESLISGAISFFEIIRHSHKNKTNEELINLVCQNEPFSKYKFIKLALEEFYEKRT